MITMSLDAAVITVLLGAFGALVGGGITVATTLFINRRDRRSAMEFDQLKVTAASVTSNARQMLHLWKSERLTAEPQSHAEMDKCHAAVRVGADLLSLVGNTDVQQAAKLVRHHSYMVAAQGRNEPDKHPEYTFAVYERTEWAIEFLLEATRAQLGLPGAIVRDFDYLELTQRSKTYRDGA
jgi:hypothetical protein